MLRHAPVICFVALCMAAIAAQLLRGLPLAGAGSAHDAGFHLIMLNALAEEAWRGALPPLWFFAPTAGLGSPAPVFYGVGSYLPALALLGLGGEPEMALSAVIALARAVGALGVLLWARRHVAGDGAAVVAAGVWLLFPFSLLHGPLIGFRYADTLALSILPWLLLAADRPMPPGRRLSAVPLIALGYAALAVTHLPQTILAALILPAWVGLTRGWRCGLVVVLGGLLGAALASWFLLPAAMLRPLINEAGWNAAALMAARSLFGPALWAEQQDQLVGPFWAILYLSWALGLGLALLGMARAGATPSTLRAAARAAALLCLTMVPPLTWLWPHLPIIIYVQLPWRQMGWLALMAGLVAAGLWMAGSRRRVLLLLAGMALFLAYPWADRLLPAHLLAAHRESLVLYPPSGDPAIFRTPFYTDFMVAEYIPSAALRSGLDWTGHTQRRAILARICAAEPCAELDRSMPGHPRAVLRPGASAGELLPIFHWPGQRCEGCRLELDPATGLARAWLLPGAGPEVAIRVVALPAQRLGLAISAAALGVLLLVSVVALRRAGRA
ncbi:MAG: hypothetical protein NTW56_12960 [Alphaproteobacteria bacterium]|nr:hypothetical protein [Alphaproteobacteria bacterium]